VVNATPGRFTTVKQSRYPLYRRLGVPQGRSEWEHKISPPTGTARVTINIYFVLLLLRVSAPIHLLHGSHLQRNTFIINAVQDVCMCTHNTIVFKILPKYIKWNCLHLLTILCFVADIYVTSGFFIRNVVLNLKIMRFFYYKFVELDYAQVALSGLCPYLGFKLGLWTPTDPPLKVLDPWHSINQAQKLSIF